MATLRRLQQHGYMLFLVSNQPSYAKGKTTLETVSYTHLDVYKRQVYPLQVSTETLYNLEDNLLLFFTGYSRSAASILREQDVKSKQDDQSMLENLHLVKELGLKSKEAFERGNLKEFAGLMNVHWESKKKRSGTMSNPEINEW